jgi:hypothetical protein
MGTALSRSVLHCAVKTVIPQSGVGSEQGLAEDGHARVHESARGCTDGGGAGEERLGRGLIVVAIPLRLAA